MASEKNKTLIQSIILANIQDQLNWIKSMATETGVLHILIGTYDLLPFCNLDGQMAWRGSEFHFARYHIENETDCQAFRNAFSSSGSGRNGEARSRNRFLFVLRVDRA